MAKHPISALFADNLLLYITFPLTSLPNLCQLLNKFAKISGLQVNMAKFQALNVSLQYTLILLLKNSFKFEWSTLSIRYLGLNLTPKDEQLYQANYPPIYRKLESDLRNRVSYKMTWMGRINSVKMTLLPRLLYLFRSLPVLIRRDHLKSFQGKIISLIWDKKGSGFHNATFSISNLKAG